MLGLIHRHIRQFEHLILGALVIQEERDADTRRAMVLNMASRAIICRDIEKIGFGDSNANLLGNYLGLRH